MALILENMGVSESTGLSFTRFDSTSTDSPCSYAFVDSIAGKEITINSSSIITGKYSSFEVNSEILVHVSSTVNTLDSPIYLGNYCVAKIIAVNNNVLTLDKDINTVIPQNEFLKYNVQIISFARFGSLSLELGSTISPIKYDATKHIGGILAIKIFNNLNLNGGHIDLTDKGIPIANKTTCRPLTNQEKDGISCFDAYAGWENSQTKEKFVLNSGDGAAFILVYGTLNIPSGTQSRIGNPLYYGLAYCRGDIDTKNNTNIQSPQDTTNIGGSTIFIGARNIKGFDPIIISKYRNSNSEEGQGICRCYIASDTKLPNDEGLYSYDNISNKTKVLSFGINGYGSGIDGNHVITGDTTVSGFNKYAQIVVIANNRKTIMIDQQSPDGPEISVGKLVMIHTNYNGDDTADDLDTIMQNNGWFMFANIIGVDGDQITIDKEIPTEFTPTKYLMQLVVCNQYSSLTMSGDIQFNMTYYENHSTATTAGSSISIRDNLTIPKYGGIVVIVCNGNLNISSARLYSSDYGWDELAYYEEGLKYIGNSQINDRIPIGGGMGSIFILARTITMNQYTVIGSNWNGAIPNTSFVTNNTSFEKLSGSNSFGGNMYKITGNPSLNESNINNGGYFSSGKSITTFASSSSNTYCFGGNYNSGGQVTKLSDQDYKMARHCSLGCGNKLKWTTVSSTSYTQFPRAVNACQGAHIFIISETINGFRQSQISTGGKSNTAIVCGSAGYGSGSESYYNLGGGGSGWAFIYCNNAPNQDTTYTVNY